MIKLKTNTDVVKTANVTATDRDADVQLLTRCQHIHEAVSLVKGAKVGVLISHTDGQILLNLLGEKIEQLARTLEAGDQ